MRVDDDGRVGMESAQATDHFIGGTWDSMLRPPSSSVTVISRYGSLQDRPLSARANPQSTYDYYLQRIIYIKNSLSDHVRPKNEAYLIGLIAILLASLLAFAIALLRQIGG